MNKLAILTLLTFSIGTKAAEIELKTLSPFVQSEVQIALDILPSSYLNSAQGRISISVETLSTDEYMTDDLCATGDKRQYGITRKSGKDHSVILSQKLVELAQRNKNVFKCSHGSFERMLQATLIHELTHVKDNFEKISTDPDFERIVGVKKIVKSGKRQVLNQNRETSPDAYEFTNLEESLAVNAEYLVLDPEFECRKPATANYLAKRLGLPIKGQCHQSYKVLAQSAYIEDNYLFETSIDPKRVYQIHYLFAGKGKSIMSRWGHAMFRLVVCAPHRTKVGPECMDDVSHHLALSYRAYMNDINLDYVKGMFGGYPSQLFIYRFHEVQQEYTKTELRDVFSVPLKLNEEQKKEFLNVTLERYWTYQGKYFFIDNNCSTESKKHLAIALDEDQAKKIHSITPYRFYKDVIKEKNNLTGGGVSIVKSLYDDLKSSFDYLRASGIYQESSLDKFLKKTSSAMRLSRYQELSSYIESIPAETRKTIILKIIFIERYLAHKFSMELPKIAFKKINKNEVIKKQVMDMGNSIKTLFMQPWEVIDSAYGVPLMREFESQYSIFKKKREDSLKSSAEKQLQSLQQILEDKIFTNELNEIEILKEIKSFTNHHLLQLSGDNQKS